MSYSARVEGLILIDRYRWLCLIVTFFFCSQQQNPLLQLEAVGIYKIRIFHTYLLSFDLTCLHSSSHVALPMLQRWCYIFLLNQLSCICMWFYYLNERKERIWTGSSLLDLALFVDVIRLSNCFSALDGTARKRGGG